VRNTYITWQFYLVVEELLPSATGSSDKVSLFFFVPGLSDFSFNRVRPNMGSAEGAGALNYLGKLLRRLLLLLLLKRLFLLSLPGYRHIQSASQATDKVEAELREAVDPRLGSRLEWISCRENAIFPIGYAPTGVLEGLFFHRWHVMHRKGEALHARLSTLQR
jgi:hypothetical protein